MEKPLNRGPAPRRPETRLAALLEIQALDQLPRTGWCQRGVARPESVAAHSFGTAVLALALGPEVSPPLDTDRAAALAVLHDLAEARLGDLPRSATELLPAGAKRAAEEAAVEALAAPFAGGETGGGGARSLGERAREALAGETREARFVRACDRLQLGLRLLGYLRAGQRGLADFRSGLERLACAEFEPCERLRRELLDAIGAIEDPGPRGSSA